MNSHRESDPPDEKSKPDVRPDSPAPQLAETADYGIDRLRELLLDTEQKEIVELRARLDDERVRVEELAPLLPEVVRRATRDEALVDASTPLVEQSLRESVRNDPSVTAEILYPVIGPAVWKAVSKAFRDLTDSLNTTLERNLTVAGLRWRWESFRTGRPVAELAMLSSLAYRVEQVYLIDAESGILLQYAGPESGPRDREVMSGMLTAIQDFVRDSFSVDASQELETLRVGDFRVWIERGPRAYLAAVIRGNAPGRDLREVLRENLRLIHRRLETLPDADDKASLSPFLEACLKEETVPTPAPGRGLAYVMLGIIVLAVAGWVALGWLEARRQADLVDRLAAEPGITVVESGEVNGEFRIAGLRDPLARNPADVVAESDMDIDGVRLDLSPYISLESEIVLQRAVAELQPPASVSLNFDAGTLEASGSATLAWIARLRADGPDVPGVDRVDITRSDFSDATWELRRREVEDHVVLFDSGATTLSASDELSLSGLGPVINNVIGMLQGAGFDAIVEVRGGADASGSPELNQQLARRRAESVRDLLVANGVERENVQTVVEESASGLPAGSGRSVSFEVRVIRDADGAGR